MKPTSSNAKGQSLELDKAKPKYKVKEIRRTSDCILSKHRNTKQTYTYIVNVILLFNIQLFCPMQYVLLAIR